MHVLDTYSIPNNLRAKFRGTIRIRSVTVTLHSSCVQQARDRGGLPQFVDKDKIDVCLFLKNNGFDENVAEVFESYYFFFVSRSVCSEVHYLFLCIRKEGG